MKELLHHHQANSIDSAHSNNGHAQELAAIQSSSSSNSNSTSGSNASNGSRLARRKDLEIMLKNPKSMISLDGLLDGITALVLDCEPMRKNKNIENFLNRYVPQGKLIFEKRINLSDFQILKTIGRGAFGKVQLVRLVDNNQVYAMKTLSKFEMVKKKKLRNFFRNYWPFLKLFL